MSWENCGVLGVLNIQVNTQGGQLGELPECRLSSAVMAFDPFAQRVPLTRLDYLPSVQIGRVQRAA